MANRRLLLMSASLVASVVACGPDATAPVPRTSSVDRGAFAKGGVPGSPWQTGMPGKSAQAHAPLGCTPRDPQYGVATIGPSGGELIVGPHRLIIPPGALTTTVTVSGTTPADGSLAIDLQPTGLQFKKPAGLVLDASSCTEVPDVVYINDLGAPELFIPAIYSNWWHTVAAPIDHFSGYAIAFVDDQ